MLAALLGVGAALTLVAGSHIVCPDGACRVLPVDSASLALFDRWRAPPLDAAFGALTWLGSLFVTFPAALAIAWWQGKTLSLRAAAFMPVALASAALLSHLSKLAVERPRPDLFQALISLPSDASFPSGHAIHATAFATAWILRPGARTRAAEILALGLLVLLVGASRLYLQVHFPSDVAFGIAVAALWVLALRCLPIWSEPGR